MEKIEYKRLYDRERTYWWNVGRRRILREALGRHVSSRRLNILDVGCGPGGNILFLSDFGKVTGLDSNEEALLFAQKQGFHAIVKGSGESIPFGGQSFDVVSILDVLEHIDSDEQALKEIFRILKNGGLLLLTVPAYPWMWSSHDEVLHHKRRYRRKELLFKIMDAGFQIKESSYFVIPSIPFRVVKMCIQKMKSIFGAHTAGAMKTDDVILPSFLNTFFIVWLAAEQYVMKFFPIPCGSSLLVVAKKPL